MTMARSTIVGVFSDEASAENALEALHSAGFGGDRVRYSGRTGTGGGFWEGVKSLFTGTAGNVPENVVNDLTDLGLSQDEASYYAMQHQNGHPIVAVRADDRAQEAAQILQTNGGSSYSAGAGTAVSGSYGQSMASTQPVYDQASSPVHSDQYPEPGGYATSEQYAQPGGYPAANQYSQRGSYMSNDQYGQNVNPQGDPSAPSSNPQQYDQSTARQQDRYERGVDPQGNQYSQAANPPIEQYNDQPGGQTYPQGDQSSQQAGYGQGDRFARTDSPQGSQDQYNQPTYPQPDQYDQSANPQVGQYGRAANMPADQPTDVAAGDQFARRADETREKPPEQYDQPPMAPADQYNQALSDQPTFNQRNEADQPPMAPADQYNQPSSDYGQGDHAADPSAFSGADSEERRRARLREEQRRAESQYNQPGDDRLNG